MRHAAESGHTQAAFNVAVMLDSGRGAARDVVQAAIWYARAAAGGNRRAAFNLGQLYESGEGVPANVDLSRAWYAAADLPAAREHLAETRSAAVRPAIVQAPEPLFPLRKSSLAPGLQQVDLVWSSPLEPEAVRFFVELRILEAGASREVWSGFVDVSSVRLPIPRGRSESGLARHCSGERLGELYCVRLVGLYGPSVLEVFTDPPGEEIEFDNASQLLLFGRFAARPRSTLTCFKIDRWICSAPEQSTAIRVSITHSPGTKRRTTTRQRAALANIRTSEFLHQQLR